MIRLEGSDRSDVLPLLGLKTKESTKNIKMDIDTRTTYKDKFIFMAALAYLNKAKPPSGQSPDTDVGFEVFAVGGGVNDVAVAGTSDELADLFNS